MSDSVSQIHAIGAKVHKQAPHARFAPSAPGKKQLKDAGEIAKDNKRKKEAKAREEAGKKADNEKITKGAGRKDTYTPVVDAEIVEEGRNPSPSTQNGDIEDAVIVPNTRALPSPRLALDAPRQFNNIKAPANNITEVPTKSVPGQRTRISTARLAGNRLSWNDMQSGKYAGSMFPGGEINKREGIKVGQSPSSRAAKDPAYKAQLLAQLESEASPSSSPIAGRQWDA